MRFNCHIHIFNGASVFNAYTLDILISRIRESNLPLVVIDAATEQLKKLFLSASGYTSDEEILRILLKRSIGTNKVSEMLESLAANNSMKLVLSDPAAIDRFSVEKLTEAFRFISERFESADEDAEEANLIDFIGYLRIALMPDIRNVTDHLMGSLTKKDAIIALMMDITKDGSGGDQFEAQLKETSDMVVTYPGRTFPFVAVNKKRPNHYDIMKRALTSMGFVGVKLYPSLGYDIGSENMKSVLRYCARNDVPVLQHSNITGFSTHNNGNKSNPSHWEPLLKTEELGSLKICFGHFGGSQNLVRNTIPIDSWTATILKLMEKHPGVYADISYHTEPMKSTAARENYFRNLKGLMADNRYRKRLLFGTDFYMARMRLKEKNHWKYVKKHLTVAEFKQISEMNPLDYLGMPKGNRKPAPNIANYVQFVRMHSEKLRSAAPKWLRDAVIKQFGESAALPTRPEIVVDWDWNNKAHTYLWIFLKSGQLSEAQKNRGFEKMGLLKMRDLSYWMKGSVPMEIWSRNVTAMAENLNSFMIHNNWKQKISGSTGTVTEKLSKSFDNGALYVFELGKQCSQLNRFD